MKLKFPRNVNTWGSNKPVQILCVYD